MTVVLRATDLSVGFAGRVVLSGVNLQLMAGQRVALVGANGSGKSTLLKALAGLITPLVGELSWCERALPRGEQRVQMLGVLLQNEVPGPFSVREAVTMGLALDGPPGAADQQKIDRALKAAYLTSLASRQCDCLSGGEIQRVRFARTVLAQPRILLLDEPTNHLDPAYCAELMEQLANVSPGTTTVISTHDLSVAATCDRVLLLHDGRIFKEGTAENVLSEKALRVALGVAVQRVEDPRGGPPFFRVAAAGFRRV